MLGWMKRRAGYRRGAEELYLRIVAHSRRPELYAKCGVPDTMDGRLEMIMLTVVLVLERLKREGEAGDWIGQRLMELLVADLDDAFRQIGIGDDGVARRVPRLAGALRERVRDYGLGLRSYGAAGPSVDDDERVAALATALLEHVYREPGASTASVVGRQARLLAAHVHACQRALDEHTSATVTEGKILLPGLEGA